MATKLFKSGSHKFLVKLLQDELKQAQDQISTLSPLKVCKHYSSSAGSGSGKPTTTTYHTATQAETLTDYQSKHAQPAKESKLPEIAKISLSEAVPWIPTPIYSTASESDTNTRVTVLDNGIRVASEPKFGSFCTVGVVLDSGSRYEVAYPSGISHFLEKLAFGNTVNMKRDQIMSTAAFRDNTVGLPKICPPENIMEIQIPKLMSYLQHHHNAQRLVVAGVGVEHDELVSFVDRYFKSGTAVWDQQPHLLHPGSKKIGVDASIAQYTGGVCKEDADLSNVSLGVNPLPELAHLVLGLESTHHQHPDFVTVCVLNVLMGGGGSFSAGGPGKGMYTRLYTNVLNKHHWIHNAVAYNHAYSDCGLFCVLASAHPSHLHELTGVLTKELVAMSTAVSADELQRAKTQLQSMVLMNLESRPVVFEDMARQVLATGDRKQPKYFIDLIRQVTLEDVHRVAAQMLTSKPSVAAYGSLDRLPSRQAIEAALVDKTGRLQSRSGLSLFR
ncbi:Peptidase M16 C-terminal [Trinorchestia longiramus]|nr:Peptidase M16 C-terminal [Trinorchestia longiramus]